MKNLLLLGTFILGFATVSHAQPSGVCPAGLYLTQYGCLPQGDCGPGYARYTAPGTVQCVMVQQGYPIPQPQPQSQSNAFCPNGYEFINGQCTATAGMAAAIGICQGVSQFKQDDCYATIKNTDYFQPSLVSLCSSVDFDDDKISCLKRIGNQAAQDQLPNGCKGQWPWSNLNSCLNGVLYAYSFPQPAPGPIVVGPPQVRCSKDTILRLIDGLAAAPAQIFRGLQQLRSYIETCQF